MARFRVLHGHHSEGGKSYGKGDIVDSASDLSTLNAPGAVKFELVDGGPTAQSTTKEPPKAQPPSPTATPAPAIAASKSEAISPGIRSTPPSQSTPPTHPSPQAATQKPEDLESMSVGQLRSLAAEEKIEVGSSVRKEELLRAIRRARGTTRRY